ncbi:MAG: PfkB family carbohydrate kinase [Anaerolineales bacterium]|nr:PfkB family carbohydrate kinase [Anaerolineales bacterium]
MPQLTTYDPIDYLVIGHIAQDETPQGLQLGGTAAYAALTARALGLRVGILTACSTKTSLGALKGIRVISLPSAETTAFAFELSSAHRELFLRRRATPIALAHVPETWRRTPIIHLAPIADEIPALLPEGFAPHLLGLTPQGWLRQWDTDGRISPRQWSQAETSLNHAGAAVISLEEVAGDENIIEEMALASRVLVVTEGADGAQLYWNHDLRRFHAPKMAAVDATGAGDIFAAAFFIRLHTTRDPWEAARFATRLAAHSVQRRGLAGIPTQEEIQTCQMEVL